MHGLGQKKWLYNGSYGYGELEFPADEIGPINKV